MKPNLSLSLCLFTYFAELILTAQLIIMNKFLELIQRNHREGSSCQGVCIVLWQNLNNEEREIAMKASFQYLSNFNILVL